MPRVFAKGEGYVVAIAGYGRATEDTPVNVPVEVAEELRGRKDLRIRWDGQDPKRQQGEPDEEEAEVVIPGSIEEMPGEPGPGEVVGGFVEDGVFRQTDEVPALTVIDEPAPGARGERE
jgi:hypothetical protein